MKVIGEFALSFTKITLMNAIIFTTVMSLVETRLIEYAYSIAVVVFALEIAKMLITTVVIFKLRVAWLTRTYFSTVRNLANMTASMVAEGACVIVFMAINVSAQILSLYATLIFCALC